jgi:uncharacterized damage-inducible protein DinB
VKCFTLGLAACFWTGRFARPDRIVFYSGGFTMPFADMLVREFDQEMSKTRTTLERVPKDEWDWKPHEKSGTLGWMAGHVATLPGFSIAVSTAPDLDLADAKSPKVEKDTDLIGLFDKVSADARAAIANLSDAQLNEPWSLKRNGKVLFTMPRYDMLRGMCFNHVIHHRGQLTMYLRTLGVPVPALYGPSADENPFR